MPDGWTSHDHTNEPNPKPAYARIKPFRCSAPAQPWTPRRHPETDAVGFKYLVFRQGSNTSVAKRIGIALVQVPTPSHIDPSFPDQGQVRHSHSANLSSCDFISQAVAGLAQSGPVRQRQKDVVSWKRREVKGCCCSVTLRFQPRSRPELAPTGQRR